ncbi:hypothetical protein HK405_002915 [Cladochytrium tenue]|nr:hypothetical protein HK405_002915 [Cladochytrium tenue]
MSRAAVIATASTAVAAAAVAAITWFYNTAAVSASAKADLHLLATDPARPSVAEKSTTEGGQRRVAVVVGGSISGLATARVLLRYFDEVIVIESAAGGFASECEAAGARRSLLAHNFSLTSFGVTMTRLSRNEAEQMKPKLESIVCSRGLIEGVLRYRLFKDSGMIADGGMTNCCLRYRPATVATALVLQGDRVKGVHVFDKVSKASEFLHADAVVDASGYYVLQ